jgi:DNA modification methylase
MFTLHNGDGIQYLRSIPSGSVSAIITDPPYGINAGMMNLGFSQSSRIEKSEWDEMPPSSDDLNLLAKSAPVVVIWGGNYFPLPPSRCFLIWDKGGGFKDRSFSECELAWTNLDSPARIYRRDPLAKGDYLKRYHKTQKPIALMSWVIENFTNEGDVIYDPYMGSGSTGVACVETGRGFIGSEINPKYFAVAEKRISQAVRKPSFFTPSNNRLHLTGGGHSATQSSFTAEVIPTAKLPAKSPRR